MLRYPKNRITRQVGFPAKLPSLIYLIIADSWFFDWGDPIAL